MALAERAINTDKRREIEGHETYKIDRRNLRESFYELVGSIIDKLHLPRGIQVGVGYSMSRLSIPNHSDREYRTENTDALYRNDPLFGFHTLTPENIPSTEMRITRFNGDNDRMRRKYLPTIAFARGVTFKGFMGWNIPTFDTEKIDIHPMTTHYVLWSKDKPKVPAGSMRKTEVEISKDTTSATVRDRIKCIREKNPDLLFFNGLNDDIVPTLRNEGNVELVKQILERNYGTETIEYSLDPKSEKFPDERFPSINEQIALKLSQEDLNNPILKRLQELFTTGFTASRILPNCTETSVEIIERLTPPLFPDYPEDDQKSRLATLEMLMLEAAADSISKGNTLWLQEVHPKMKRKLEKLFGESAVAELGCINQVKRKKGKDHPDRVYAICIDLSIAFENLYKEGEFTEKEFTRRKRYGKRLIERLNELNTEKLIINWAKRIANSS